MHLLIIEDIPQNQEDAIQAVKDLYLEKVFTEITMVDNLTEAMRLLQSGSINAILSDVLFPAKPGEEANTSKQAEIIRAFAIEKNVPFVFCTDNGSHSGGALSAFCTLINDSPHTGKHLAKLAGGSPTSFYEYSLLFTHYDELVFSDMNSRWNRYAEETNSLSSKGDLLDFLYNFKFEGAYSKLLSSKTKFMLAKHRCNEDFDSMESIATEFLESARADFEKKLPSKNWETALKILYMKV